MTLKQIAEHLEVPESTLRLYRDEFEDFVPVSGAGRRRRYETTAAEVLKRIVEGKRQGLSAGAIRQELSRTATPQEKRKAITQDERIAEIAATLTMQTGELALLRAEVGALRAEIGRLVGLLQRETRGTKPIEAVQIERLRERDARRAGEEQR